MPIEVDWGKNFTKRNVTIKNSLQNAVIKGNIYILGEDQIMNWPK